MADKVLNTRILLKYDTFQNWTTNNPVLKAGEMAIATVAVGQTQPGFTNLPNVVIKVGDGTSHYNDLKFVSALAADVHAWAKNAIKPSYTYQEINGLEERLQEVAQGADTNTKYTLVATEPESFKFELRSKELDGEWTKTADLDLSGLVSRIAALETKVGVTPVATQIKNAINALDAVKVTAGAGSVIGAVEQVDGVVVATTKKLTKADIPAIDEGQVTGLTARLTKIEGDITAGDTATLASAKEYSDGQLKTVKEALDYTDPNYAAGQFVTKVTQNDGVIEVSRAAVGIANVTGLEARLNKIESGSTDLGANKQDKLTWDAGHEYDAESNPAATVSSVTARINALDYTGGAAAANKFVTKITQNDGVVAAEYAQPTVANISGLRAELDGLGTRIDTKQDKLTFTSTPNGTDNRVTTEKYVMDKVAALNGAMHFIGKVESIPEENTDFKAGDVILVGYDEYVFDGTTWNALGNESIYQTKELASQQHEALTTKVTELSAKHDRELQALGNRHNTELGDLDTKFSNAIKALNKADAAVAGQFVTSVTEADGIVTVTRAALKATDVPALPQDKITGLTDKLTELEESIGTTGSGSLEQAKEYTDATIKAKIEALDAPIVSFGQGKVLGSIVQNDGVISAVARDLAAADIPVIPQSKVTGVTADIAAAKKAGEDAAATAEANAKKYTDTTKATLVASLKNTDTAVAKNFVTEVKQADGVVSVRRAPVADIALSGSTDDLKQGTMVLIFNCGNSQVGTDKEYVM